MSVEHEQGLLSVAAVLHELEGRAVSMSMLAEAVRQNARYSDSQWLADRLARIESAAKEMQRIIEAIRVLDDNSEPHRETVDVSGLSAQILQRELERAGANLPADVRVQSNIRVFGDPRGIEVLLSNVLANALKFSMHRRPPEIRVTATRTNDKPTVHVSDNGIGIAPEDATRMFELFARCHSHFAGSGVGLAIASRIVQRHRGRIWAEGELGVGTTISFFL